MCARRQQKVQTGSHFEPKPVPPPLLNKCDWEIDPSELDFLTSNVIGKGSFGEILRTGWRGTPVAVKRILPLLSDDRLVIVDHLKLGDFGLRPIRRSPAQIIIKQTKEEAHKNVSSPIIKTESCPDLREELQGGEGEEEKTMSFMRGDLLSRTGKLVKGMAKTEPAWLKAMKESPPATFPRIGKLQTIILPEDVYVQKFFQKHPDSKHEDAIKFVGFNPPPARVFGQRVIELKKQGVNEEEAMAVADMEYRLEKKGKKKAYSRLKQIAKLQGKKPPPNPYPSAIKEIQAEERKYVRERFFNPEIRKIVQKLKEDQALERQERMRGNEP
ncbi:hypothetical protein SAY87_013158 [Trapa incisa]|uniref:Small ribosomal subunit protein mS23 n=1 Tax=Trapa incisa TaxID=236973 RepID=A0AAN7KJ11_9MYRT|nr:hypothetical protein SAY87_013158 [Trapa incisa]